MHTHQVHYNVGKQNHGSKREKKNTKGRVLHSAICMKHPQEVDHKTESGLVGARGRREGRAGSGRLGGFPSE